MKIIPAGPDNADSIAQIVSESNKDIAQKFKITKKNNPKHPSFYTKKWVLADIKKGEEYFIFKEKDINKGCVAFEQPNNTTAYMNRLCVLPMYRHNKIGQSLISYILEYSRSKNIHMVSIGIIADHHVLKAWYSTLGFTEVKTQKFDHLPFDVTYMKYEL